MGGEPAILSLLCQIFAKRLRALDCLCPESLCYSFIDVSQKINFSNLKKCSVLCHDFSRQSKLMTYKGGLCCQVLHVLSGKGGESDQQECVHSDCVLWKELLFSGS